MVHVRRSLPLLSILALVVNCADTSVDPEPGQDGFVTEERDSSFRGADAGSAGSAAGGGSAAGPQGPTGSREGAPAGRTGEVEEADIYRVDANRLFYLNTYRGFVAYDLGDPAHPVQLGRLPVHGYPIEMFVEGNTVYALLRDALYLTREGSGLAVTRRNVSQLLVIDVTDLAAPRLLRTLDIVGQLREGVSRKIDDTIYVVSYLPRFYSWTGSPSGQSPTEQAWVYAYNVADPSNVVEVDRLKIFEGGGGSSTTGNSSVNTYFSGVAISATANTLHVVENWYTWGSSWAAAEDGGSSGGCSGSQYSSSSRAVVSIIDISDPTGKIRRHARFTTPGSLSDQFKQTYVYDAATRKGYYLGIFARQDWNSTGCRWGQEIRNTLEAWDITDGDQPVMVDSLVFGKPDETVRGSSFDLTRKVAYAITARQVDPLYAISFEDPTDLKILSAIDGLSGDMTVFRTIDQGRYLIGIGRDTSDTCEGFGAPTTGWSSNIAVSIIDVRDPTRIRLVQRKCVTVQNAEWVWSQLSWDLDQAHKMIGMFSDGRANLITVPVNYYSRTDSTDGWYWYRPSSAVGMMTYDTRSDDPSKAPAEQTVLRNWGTVVHTGGEVTRSIMFAHQSSQGNRRMMVNLSDTHVSVVDIEDLSNPVTRSTIEVAPYHARLYRFGDHVVEEIQLGGSSWWRPGASEFRVKRAAPGLDDAAPVATFTIGRIDRVVQWKNLLLIFRPVGDPSVASWRSTVSRSEVVAYDLGDPTRPRRRGSVEVDFTLGGWWGFSCGGDAWGYWPGSWSGQTTLATSAEGVAALVYRPLPGGFGQDLVLIDATDPDGLEVKTRQLIRHTWDPNSWSPPPVQYTSLLGAGDSSPGVVATSRHEVRRAEREGASFVVVKYHATHFDRRLEQDWSVNTPGPAIRVFTERDTTRILSLDTRNEWRPGTTGTFGWETEQRLHLLTRQGNVARLADSLALGTLWLGDVVGDSGRLFLNLHRNWWSSSDEPITTNRLMMLDLGGDRLAPRFTGDLGVSYPQLMGLHGDRLFVNLPGDGVLVVNVSRLDAPVGTNFLRTLGWATHLVFDGSMAFVAAGNFGVFELDLSGPANIVSD